MHAEQNIGDPANSTRQRRHYREIWVLCWYCCFVGTSVLNFHCCKWLECMKLNVSWRTGLGDFIFAQILLLFKFFRMKISIVLSFILLFCWGKKPFIKMFWDDFMANCFIYEIFFFAFHERKLFPLQISNFNFFGNIIEQPTGSVFVNVSMKVD